MTKDTDSLRPQQVGHEIRHGRLGVDDGDIHVPERRPDAMGADQIDIDFRTGAAKVSQNRHGQLYREARRHLHPQRALNRRALVADVVERVFEPVERLHHRRQQVLARLGERQRVWLAIEQLHAGEPFQRDDMA